MRPGIKMRSEGAFTLIELLTVIGTIGLLAALGLTSFNVYKANAAYASVETTMINARNAVEAGISDPDNLPPAVALVSQKAQGSIQDNAAANFLPGMMLPSKMKFQASYDPTCVDAACQSEFLEAKHCWGKEYMRWVRFGDGVEMYLDHISGIGCN